MLSGKKVSPGTVRLDACDRAPRSRWVDAAAGAHDARATPRQNATNARAGRFMRTSFMFAARCCLLRPIKVAFGATFIQPPLVHAEALRRPGSGDWSLCWLLLFPTMPAAQPAGTIR